MHARLSSALRFLRLSVVLTGLMQLAILAAAPSEPVPVGPPLDAAQGPARGGDPVGDPADHRTGDRAGPQHADAAPKQILSKHGHPTQVAILAAKLSLAGPGSSANGDPFGLPAAKAPRPPAARLVAMRSVRSAPLFGPAQRQGDLHPVRAPPLA